MGDLRYYPDERRRAFAAVGWDPAADYRTQAMAAGLDPIIYFADEAPQAR